ncbi:DPY30 domain-containing protein 1 isoform X3 [Choloepus didactylus]|uniref:DPY30 domain-containing protein 1 isoform X3 n=1 Tax=Choloepus didactylus TaxID=27675 RepID=UPI00189F1F43|nr:DPY30 domain-containing protein 1 isoform X3 [Choloepus didactylus]
MESLYLQKYLGKCLTQGLAEMARIRPVDPIEYLALWIYKYKENVAMEQQKQKEMAALERERALALLEQEMMERLKAEELLFQQQQLELQLELEMQEKERQRIEELRRAQEQLEQEAAADSSKTLAEISDRYGAPNLSRVEELDEPLLSDEKSLGFPGEITSVSSRLLGTVPPQGDPCAFTPIEADVSGSPGR